MCSTRWFLVFLVINLVIVSSSSTNTFCMVACFLLHTYSEWLKWISVHLGIRKQIKILSEINWFFNERTNSFPISLLFFFLSLCTPKKKSKNELFCSHCECSISRFWIIISFSVDIFMGIRFECLFIE